MKTLHLITGMCTNMICFESTFLPVNTVKQNDPNRVVIVSTASRRPVTGRSGWRCKLAYPHGSSRQQGLGNVLKVGGAITIFRSFLFMQRSKAYLKFCHSWRGSCPSAPLSGPLPASQHTAAGCVKSRQKLNMDIRVIESKKNCDIFSKQRF